MRYRFRLCFLLLLVSNGFCLGQEKSPTKIVDVPKTARTAIPGLQPNSQILLPNGWSLSPTGKQVPLGDFPVNVALTADGKFAAVLHCGYGSHEVRIVSIEKQTVVSTAQVDQSFYGMTFCQGDKFLAISGGEDENVYTFPFEDGFLAKPKTTTLASKTEKFVVSGVSAFDSSKELIVCGLLGNEVRAISQDTGETRFKLGLGEGGMLTFFWSM